MGTVSIHISCDIFFISQTDRVKRSSVVHSASSKKVTEKRFAQTHNYFVIPLLGMVRYSLCLVFYTKLVAFIVRDYYIG
jgi:hypothetical protein